MTEKLNTDNSAKFHYSSKLMIGEKSIFDHGATVSLNESILPLVLPSVLI